MTRPLNPYDTGDVLEPKPWVVEKRAGFWTAGHEVVRTPEASDWGKVDFNNDEDATDVVIRVRRDGGTLIVEIEQVNDMDDLEIKLDADTIWVREA